MPFSFHVNWTGSGWCSPMSDSLSRSWSLFSVMSLCETRNRTTSPFSFLMGTMSNRHQNLEPFPRKRDQNTDTYWFGKKKYCTKRYLTCQSAPAAESYRSSCTEWFQSWTPGVHPELFASVWWEGCWSHSRTESDTCSSSASARRGQSRSVRRSHRSSRQWDRETGPEHSPGRSCCLSGGKMGKWWSKVTREEKGET